MNDGRVRLAAPRQRRDHSSIHKVDHLLTEAFGTEVFSMPPDRGQIIVLMSRFEMLDASTMLPDS